MLPKSYCSKPIPSLRYAGWIVDVQERAAWGGKQYFSFRVNLHRAVGERQPTVMGVRCRFFLWEGDDLSCIGPALKGLGRESALRSDGSLAVEQLMGMYIEFDLDLKIMKHDNSRYVMASNLASSRLRPGGSTLVSVP